MIPNHSITASFGSVNETVDFLQGTGGGQPNIHIYMKGYFLGNVIYTDNGWRVHWGPVTDKSVFREYTQYFAASDADAVLDRLVEAGIVEPGDIL
ncbi:hypothetical protein [Pedobacter faecalis]|uniref:hypothetical protein n=1 Tax=Pedobacter faecalis TaxID=3041495 RepID=UPI00254A715A|nr:hypothetical protein [Pedobacter sp. ELA7]